MAQFLRTFFHVLPALESPLRYTQVSGGGAHAVLLRNNGTVAACGTNESHQLEIPTLPDGLVYLQVSAGYHHTVLLRSDGKVVACGPNPQSSIPSRATWGEWFTLAPRSTRYVANPASHPVECSSLVLQVSYDGRLIHFTKLSGEEHCAVEAAPDCLLLDVPQLLVRAESVAAGNPPAYGYFDSLSGAGGPPSPPPPDSPCHITLPLLIAFGGGRLSNIVDDDPQSSISSLQ